MKARVVSSTDWRVVELVRDYLTFARGYYVKHGLLTPEYTHIYNRLTSEIEASTRSGWSQEHGRTVVETHGQKWNSAGLHVLRQ
jgi:hypothetical protein